MTDPSQVKIVIETPGPSITIEATGTLEAVADKALALYREALADWPKTEQPTRGAGFTINSTTERSWQ